jgi:predicted RecA/RadA family phage recombinase
MKNFLQKGESITVAAPATQVSGDYVRVGAFSGVCVNDAASGANVVIQREGIFTLPKATGTAWAVGDALYWDAAAKKFTTVSTGNLPAGVAAAAALSADTTGAVNIETASSGNKVAMGQLSTVTASDTVVTGLAKVISAIAVLDSDPTDDPEWATASIGDQAGTPAAGSILVKTWKNTGGTDPTPAAATTFTKKVNWIAFGF